MDNTLTLEGEYGEYLYLSTTPEGLLNIEAGKHPYVSINHILPMEIVHGWLMNIFLKANFDPRKLAHMADIDDPRLISFIKELK